MPDQSGSCNREEYLRVGETLTAPILQGALPGGLPVPSSVLILADPGAGRELLTMELLSAHLIAGHRILWISLENFPNAVRAMFEFGGFGRTIHERTDSLEFVDCYSGQVGVKSAERYSADPLNLPNLSVVTSLAVTKLSRDSHLVVMLDSLSSLVQMAGARAAIEFFRTIVGKARSVQGDLLTTLNREAFSPAILACIQEMVDCVLELRMTEDQTKVRRYLRVRKMLGRKYDSTSIPFDIDQEHGILRRIDALIGGCPTGERASPWKETPTYDGEQNGMRQNDALGAMSDREMESYGLNSGELTEAPMAAGNLDELSRVKKGELYLSKKKAISEADPSVHLSPAMQSSTIEEALAKAIDGGLSALGEIVRDTIYDRLEQKYQLRREEIPEKLDAFHNALQRTFGAGARVIEAHIVKTLDSGLDLGLTEHADWTIVDYFEVAKKTKGRG